MQNNGYSKDSILNAGKNLKILNRHTDLNNPENVKNYVARRETSNGYKRALLWAYNKYSEYHEIKWSRPKYRQNSKMISVPTTEQLDTLIASIRSPNSTMLRLSKETGLRPTELCNLKTRDVDIAQQFVYPTTAKNGTPRKLKITKELTATIQKHITQQKLEPDNSLFNISTRIYSQRYRRNRNNVANKLNQPELRSIRLYDFRHYYATRLYAKTKDILLVQHQLGHRSLQSTLVYTHLVNYNEEEEWTCRTATNVKQATELIENGFVYVTEIDGYKLFRKRK